MAVTLLNSYWMPAGTTNISFSAGNYILLTCIDYGVPTSPTGAALTSLGSLNGRMDFYGGFATSTETNLAYDSGLPAQPMLLQVFSGVQSVSTTSNATVGAGASAYSFPVGSVSCGYYYGIASFCTLGDSGSSGMTQVESSTVDSFNQWFNTPTAGSAKTGSYTVSNTVGYGYFYWITLVPAPTAPIVTSNLSASISTITCSDATSGAVLSWTTLGAATVKISANGIILGTFGDGANSLTVYPNGTTTYVLTATNSNGTVTQSVTVTLSNTALTTTTVDGSVSWFNNQSNFAAGPYAVTYVTGSYEYEPGFGWTVNGNENIFIVNPNAPKIPGFYITDTPNAVISGSLWYDWGHDFAPDFGPDFYANSFGGQIVDNALNTGLANLLLAPGNTTLYGSQSACVAGNAGLSPSIYQHKGNAPIGIALNDNPYYDDYSGSPPVTYKLCGPGPIPLLAVSPSTGLQGTARTLSWTIGGNVTSASIDNGIGSVNIAGGSTTVSPTSTTVYTITTYDSASGITITYSATVIVLLPTSPQNLFVTGQCGGSIDLVWTPGTNHTNDIVQRSTDDITWTTIATIGPTVGYYADSTPTRGTVYYYRVAGYDGLSADNAYSNVVQSVAYSDPSAPTGLTVSTSGLIATLNWTTSGSAIGYNVFRGTTSGGESGTLINVFPVFTNFFIDYGPLEAGIEYYWVVKSYGYCYVNSAPSNEVSATPYPCQDAYAPITLPSTSWNAEDIPTGD